MYSTIYLSSSYEQQSSILFSVYAVFINSTLKVFKLKKDELGLSLLFSRTRKKIVSASSGD